MSRSPAAPGLDHSNRNSTECARGLSWRALGSAVLAMALLAGCTSTRVIPTVDPVVGPIFSTGDIERPGEGRYQGQLRDGLRHGRGVQTGPEGVYEGDWANNLQDGFGELRGVNGSRYIGAWRAGLRQGAGSWTSVSGESYDGEWLQDRPHGHGIHREADGTLYIGAWVHGQPAGDGRLITASAVVYEGQWSAGERDGVGRESRPDGAEYLGEWVAGRRTGTGTQRFADDSQFEGVWEFDQPAGPGTWRYPTGIEVQGVFQGPLVSSGLVQLPSGATYAGPVTTRRATTSNGTSVSGEPQPLVAPSFLRWLEQVAGTGDRHAQLLLGQAILLNDPSRSSQARELFANAAADVPEAGYRLALLDLAVPGLESPDLENPDAALLALDQAVAATPDAPLTPSDAAARALRDAAARGHPGANRIMGDLLCQTTAAPDRRAQGLAHYRMALRGGDPMAAERLAACLCRVAEQRSAGARVPTRETRDDDVNTNTDPLREAINVLEWYATATGFWRELATLANVEALRGNPLRAREHARAALDAASPAGGAAPRASRPTPATPVPARTDIGSEPDDAALEALRALIDTETVPDGGPD